MKNKIWVSLALLLFYEGACSSLKDSVVGDKMRFQGSFGCKTVSEENPSKKETLAEVDVSRVRCAKDEWQIHNDQIIFTRTLYQTKACENVLGRIEFVSPYQSTAKRLWLSRPQCKVVRVNPSWLGEDSGRCMLNELKLETPYDLHSVYHCSHYVPDFCDNESEALNIESAAINLTSEHEPYPQIGISREDGSRIMSCKRYAAE